jgi:hypothetical protein
MSWFFRLPDATEWALSTANGIAVRGVLGARMPPVNNVNTPYAMVDGALYQRTQVKPRVITFLLDAVGTDMTTLTAIRDALVTASNPHRSVLPVTIIYRPGAAGTGMLLYAYYEAGLEGGVTNGFVEDSIALRFLAVDPYWYYETAIAAQALDVYDSMATPNYIIERDANGHWSNMHAGADNTIDCLAIAPNGDVYAGGHFHNIGGVACAHIARWDVATQHWVAMGAGCDDLVHSLAFTANGDLYVGGEFHNAGGGAALHIAKWVNSTTTWSAVGAGLDNLVYAMVVAANGTLYVGGDFANVAGGGIAVAKIAAWNGAAWSALGAGTSYGNIRSLAVSPSGILYSGEWANIEQWDGTAWSNLGTGVNGIVLAIDIAPNGEVYAGGTFTTAGGLAVGYIAKWNGVSWSALGSGVDAGVNIIEVTQSGEVYVAGNFVNAGGRSTPMRWAIWVNNLWVPGWIGSFNNTLEYLKVEDDRIIVAGVFTAATTPGVTEITTTCSARAYPTIAITGPGRLLYLINYTTGQVIYFDITLVASEVLTIDLRPGYKTVTSSFRGNLISGVLAGSLVTWYLTPGLNHIGCYVDNAGAAAVYGYTPAYWGAS